MTRYDRRLRTFAVCLSALAGFVDALAFLEMGGFFVSFMSGNSTRLGVGLTHGGVAAATALGLIGCFVLGVVMGSLVSRATTRHSRTAVLGLVSAGLVIAAGSHALGLPRLAIATMALAMGAENAVFQRNGQVAIGLTYMTGALVKVGERIAAMLRGGDRFAWAPYLFLWLGLVVGAAAGAAVYPRLGLQALWIAATVAALLAVIARATPQDGDEDTDRDAARAS